MLANIRTHSMKQHSFTRLRGVIAFLVCLCVVQQSVFADTESVTYVQLRSTVRLKAEQSEFTVGDIATVTGEQSAKIHSIPLDIKDKLLEGRWHEIKVDELREILKATPSINLGSIVIQGMTCSVMQRTSGSTEAHQQVMKDMVKSEPRDPKLDPQLQDHIERWILARLSTKKPNTRIRFRSQDAQMLSMPTVGRIVEITEVGRSKRMSIHVIVYEQSKIILDTTVRCDVQIQRQVRVTKEQIRRDQPINNEHTIVETRWLSPVEPIIQPDTALGLVCKNTIDPGTMLLASMLETPILIERGEVVSAKSLSGSVSVTMSARARQSGRLGDLIELESRDRKKRFFARIAGPGRVVIEHQGDKQASSKKQVSLENASNRIESESRS